eukprot:PhF_6_TR23249/c2_g1_i1/m.32625
MRKSILVLSDVLSVKDCFGSLSSLTPAARQYSPSIGLLMKALPTLFHNLNTFPRDCLVVNQSFYVNTFDVTRELFSMQGMHGVRPVSTLSKPASHLTPKILGHFLGCALTSKDVSHMEAILKAHGFATNKVCGQWTGVSMARYKKLYLALQGGVHGYIARGVFLRFVWERSNTRKDLLEYLTALEEHLGNGSVFINDERRRKYIMDPELPTDDPIENMLHSIASAYSLKVPIRMRKQRFLQIPMERDKRVTDCVEVCIREICEYVGLQNDDIQNRLSFVKKSNTSCMTDEEDKDWSEEWFQLCQGLPGCVYLSIDVESQLKYELAPGIANAAKAVGILLYQTPSWEDFSHLQSQGFTVSSSVVPYRLPGLEEQRSKEVLILKHPDRDNWIEIEFEILHPTAKVTHKRNTNKNHLQAVFEQHVRHTQHARLSSSSEDLLEWVLSAILDPNSLPKRTAYDAFSYILAHRTVPSETNSPTWNPIESDSFVADGLYADLMHTVKTNKYKSIEMLRVCVQHSELHGMLPWLMQDVSMDTDVATLYEILSRASSELCISESIKRHQPLLSGSLSFHSLLRHPISSVKIARMKRHR